jgi:hypothetical protein
VAKDCCISKISFGKVCFMAPFEFVRQYFELA